MTTDEVAALVREVIAEPVEDGPRAVLADVLQAAGDPRGELISLQLLASRGNRDRDARIHELLAAHAKGWLGRLRDAALACRFDRGFLSTLELGSSWRDDDARWSEAAADPILATVEELVRGNSRGVVYKQFLLGPAMVNLRRIEVFDRGSLEGLETTTAPIEHVAMDRFTTDIEYRQRDRERAWAQGATIVYDREHEANVAADEANRYAPRLLAALAQRASITSLGLSIERVEQLSPLPWFDRIEALTISSASARRGLALFAQLGKPKVTLTTSPHLEPCERRFPWDYKIELIRGPDRTVCRISGEWLLQPVAALEALPAEVTRVEIEQSSDLIAMRIRNVVARRGVEVVEVPVRANNFVWEIRDPYRTS